MASVIATWRFAAPGVRDAVSVLKASRNATDAVEEGIKTVELDPSVTSTGYGGLPNANGVLQLDAAVMTSHGKLGSVMALEGYTSAIDHARLVAEHSPHTILAGNGAHAFSLGHGKIPSNDLLTRHAIQRYEEHLKNNSGPQLHQNGGMAHSDTVGMIVRDPNGLITAGCATSGTQFKADGRVGDSPIFGAGLYADPAGGAVASGDGDKMLRFCLAFLVVERMRAGDTAEQACHHAVRRVSETDPTCQTAVAAMSKDGEVGAACTHNGFDVVVWQQGMSDYEIRVVPGHVDTKWHHSCV